MASQTPSESHSAQRLRVAVVYPFFAHYRQPILEELTSAGRHEYTLVGAARDPDAQIAEAQAYNFPRFIEAPWTRKILGLRWQRGLVRLAILGDFDSFIFLGNPAWPATWIAASIARLRRISVLFWTHGWLRRERGPKGAVRNCFYRLAHGLLLYGTRARQIGIEAGFSASRLHAIYNSLDFDSQAHHSRNAANLDVIELRKRFFAKSHLPIVIASARLTAAKQFDLLLRATALVNSSGHEINVLFIGDGPARYDLECLAKRLSLSVHFYGTCFDEGVLASLFGIATVLVSPGNVGLTCMHSLGYGVPVITHDDSDTQMPEAEAIVPGLNGDLFRKGSADDLAKKIILWTSQPLSKSLSQVCKSSIADNYNPHAQRVAIERAIDTTWWAMNTRRSR
jgi:glycosyltransferase involved in cell wall biosynthesis